MGFACPGRRVDQGSSCDRAIRPMFYLWEGDTPPRLTTLAGAVITSFLDPASRRTMFLATLPVTCTTIHLWLIRPISIPQMAEDYSYSLHPLAYRSQQTFVLRFPAAQHRWLTSPFALTAGLANFSFSWKVVDKRVLAHRKRLTVLIECMLQASVRMKAAWAK